MDTKEYLELSKKADDELNRSMNQFELYQFTYVWLKSRMPEAYKELVSRFEHLEGEIYAARECERYEEDRRYQDDPF